MATSPALAKLPLVAVVWDDAHGKTAGEHTLEELKRDYHAPATITTFGLLAIDDEAGITLMSEVTGTVERDGMDTYRGQGFIPRGMIREVIELGVPKRPRPSRRTPPTTKGRVLPAVGEEIEPVSEPAQSDLPET